MAVAVVVVDERRNGLKDVGVAVGTVAFFVLATPDIVEIPLKVAEDNKIKQAVIVQIDPSSTGGPTRTGNAGFFGNVGESAIAIVVVEFVAAVGSNVEICEAVVVVVSDSHAHAVAGTLQTRFFGDIFEGAIGFLAVEAVPVIGTNLLREGALRSRILKGRAIDEENGEATV